MLILLEFQSTTDAIIALRMLEYTAMLYHDMVREGVAPKRLPPVLPVVLYNGEPKWSAATEMRDLIGDVGPILSPYQPSQRHILLDEQHTPADDGRLRRLTRAVLLLEQSRSPEQLARVAGLLKDWLGSSGREELKRVFAAWLWVLSERLRRGDDEPSATPPELTLEDMKMTLEERVISWREPVLRQGIEQGIEQGREQVLDAERGLLRRQAEVRFGAETAERLFGILRRESDLAQLAAIGEAIVRCDTGTDLLRQTAPTRNAAPTNGESDV